MSDFSAKASALAVISSVEAEDQDKFDEAFKSVDDEVALLLERFLVEVVTGKYEVFRKEDGPKFHKNPHVARAVLRAWQRVSSARGRLAARMAFESVLSTRRSK